MFTLELVMKAAIYSAIQELIAFILLNPIFKKVG